MSTRKDYGKTIYYENKYEIKYGIKYGINK